MLYGNIEQLTLLPYVNPLLKTYHRSGEDSYEPACGRYELSFPESFLMISEEKRTLR